MKRFGIALLPVLALFAVPLAQGAQSFTEGNQYNVIDPAQKTSVPAGKVEVMEVFSYACPACNLFQPTMAAVQRNLPPNAQLVFLPASFHPEEDWLVFQRAYFAAQALGISARTHQAVFDAIWETGELATLDTDTHRMKNPLPSIEDVAKFYQRVAGVKAETFLATANSPATDAKIKAADAQIVAMKVPGTPCLIVNGRYGINMDTIRTQDDLIDLIGFLVAKDAKR